MSLPVPSNTTCDVYHVGSPLPPASPDVAGVSAYLMPDFRSGSEQSEGVTDDALRWTHVLLVDVDTDIRDAYSFGVIGAGGYDKVYVPDRSGTTFNVVFVERVARGLASDHKRVFLNRGAPTWPTNEV